MAVVKNMMVRVGGDFSEFVDEAVKATTAAQKWSTGTKKAFEQAQQSASGVSNVSRRLGNAGTALQSAGNQVSTLAAGWQRVSGVLGRVLSVTALVAFSRNAIEAASDLAEVQNVVDKAFGDMSGQAEAFAKTAIRQFGLTELQAKQFSANFMAMGQSMGLARQQAADMAIDLAGLSGDVASFFNLDQEAAYTKLKAVYTGETEALKELGVVMTQANLEAFALSQGITTSYSAMSQAEKVALRYNYIMSTLAYAQGDFADTAHQWANNVRVLRNQFSSLIGIIGKGFIAVLNPVVTVLNTIMSALVDFANGVSEVFSQVFGSAKTALSASAGSVDVSGLSSALDDVSSAASDASDGVGSVGDAAKSASSAAKELARSVMGFDKINKLTASSSGSSGGGSGGSGSGTGSGAGAGVSGGLVSGGESVLGDVLNQTSALTAGLQKFKDFLSTLDFSPLQESWEKLKEAGGRLAEVITGGLQWGVEHVLEPLAKWSIEEAIPKELELVANGFALIADALTLAKPLLSWVWDNVLEPLAKAAADTWTKGLDGLNAVLEDIDGVLQDIIDVVEGRKNLGELIGNLFTLQNIEDFLGDISGLLEVLGTVSTYASSPISIAVALAQYGWTTVLEWVKEKVGGVLSFSVTVANNAGEWWNNVKEWWAQKVGDVKEFTTGVKNGASTWWSNVKAWWKEKVGTLSVGVTIKNAASTWWNNVKNWWKEKVGTLTAKLKISLPKITLEKKTVTVLGKNFTYPTGFKVKWNAKGGILDGAQLFGMAGNTLLGGGEAGREAILPLERNTGWMDTLADRVASRVSGDSGSNQPIVVQVVLDGKVVAESTVRQWKQQARHGDYPLAGLT